MPTEAELFAALKQVKDPELDMDVVSLGLVYEAAAQPNGRVEVVFTLTYPGCPAAGDIAAEIGERLARLPGVRTVVPKLVLDPPWDPSRMSEEARLELGYPV